jgi:hypothetical protein
MSHVRAVAVSHTNHSFCSLFQAQKPAFAPSLTHPHTFNSSLTLSLSLSLSLLCLILSFARSLSANSLALLRSSHEHGGHGARGPTKSFLSLSLFRALRAAPPRPPLGQLEALSERERELRAGRSAVRVCYGVSSVEARAIAPSLSPRSQRSGPSSSPSGVSAALPPSASRYSLGARMVSEPSQHALRLALRPHVECARVCAAAPVQPSRCPELAESG